MSSSAKEPAAKVAILSVLSIGAALLAVYPAIYIFIGLALKESGSGADVPNWLAGALAAALIGAAASVPWIFARRSALPLIFFTGIFFMIGLVLSVFLVPG